MKRQNFIGVVIFLLLKSLAFAQHDAGELWKSAQDAYLKQDYHQATSLFEQVLEIKPSYPSAMYNLGNCYLKTGDIGKAILWYERALRYRPNDPDILHNLSIAEARRDNPVVEINEFFLARWVRTASQLLPPGIWAIVSLIFSWTIVWLCIISIKKGYWGRRSWIAMTMGFCFVATLLLGLQRYRDFRRDDVAIVLADEVLVLIAPEEGSQLVSGITAGEKVTIIDSLNGYFKVRLVNLEQGWIAVNEIEKI